MKTIKQIIKKLFKKHQPLPLHDVRVGNVVYSTTFGKGVVDDIDRSDGESDPSIRVEFNFHQHYLNKPIKVWYFEDGVCNEICNGQFKRIRTLFKDKQFSQ